MKQKVLLQTFALFYLTVAGNHALAFPPELNLLKQEYEDQIAKGLQKEGIVFGKALREGMNPVINPRLRDTQSSSGYLQHDEESFSSSTILPLEPFSRLNKRKMEEVFLEKGSSWDRVTAALNSNYGTQMQLLMYQEPTLAAAAMNTMRAWDVKEASYQRDRQMELAFRATQKDVSPEFFFDLDRCISLQTVGKHGSSLTGGFSYGGPAAAGDYEAAVQYCEAQANMVRYLSSRNGLGTNQCEWSSLVMFGHLSSEVAARMRAQFGDDELCIVAQDNGSGGKYITLRRKAVAPSFSTRQLWWEEYQSALQKITDIVDKALAEGGYSLTEQEIAMISISPSVKASQELIEAIRTGYHPKRYSPELKNWWAMERASAFVDFTCSEAELALKEAESSPATRYEKERWKNKVEAVCSARHEIINQLKQIERERIVFDYIYTEGKKAEEEFSRGTMDSAKAQSQRNEGSKDTLLGGFGGYLPNEVAEHYN